MFPCSGLSGSLRVPVFRVPETPSGTPVGAKPSLGVIVPGSHAVAAVAPVAQAEPAGHEVQSLGDVAPVELR